MGVLDNIDYKIAIKNIVIALVIIALGITIANQTKGYYEKVNLLKAPCNVCAENYPELKECIYKPIQQTENNNYNIKINLSLPN